VVRSGRQQSRLGTVALAIRRSLLTWPVQIIGCVLLFGAA